MARKLNMKAFADYLRKWLEQNNLTQYDLAKRADIAPATISNWLNGKTQPRELDVFNRLEEATGVPIGKWISLLTNRPYKESKSAADVAALRAELEDIKRRIG